MFKFMTLINAFNFLNFILCIWMFYLGPEEDIESSEMVVSYPADTSKHTWVFQKSSQSS